MEKKSNEKVLQEVGEKRCLCWKPHFIQKTKLIGHITQAYNHLINLIFEEKISKKDPEDALEHLIHKTDPDECQYLL